MTLTDLVICGFATARLANYFEMVAYETSRRVEGSPDFKPDHPSFSQPWLWTLIRVQVSLQLSSVYWAAITVLLILTLADNLPAGWAYVLQLPVYALAVSSVVGILRLASRAVMPNKPLGPLDPLDSKPKGCF